PPRRASDLQSTMQPPDARRRSRAATHVRIAPMRLISKTSVNTSSSYSASRRMTPAALTSTCSWSKSPISSRTRASSRTSSSTTCATAGGPAGLGSPAAVPGAPSPANRSAIAAPIPLVPPVTSTDWPVYKSERSAPIADSAVTKAATLTPKSAPTRPIHRATPVGSAEPVESAGSTMPVEPSASAEPFILRAYVFVQQRPQLLGDGHRCEFHRAVDPLRCRHPDDRRGDAAIPNGELERRRGERNPEPRAMLLHRTDAIEHRVRRVAIGVRANR